MRFLTCHPNQDANYTEEAAMFYSQPLNWLRKEFTKEIFTHVVAFSCLDEVSF